MRSSPRRLQASHRSWFATRRRHLHRTQGTVRWSQLPVCIGQEMQSGRKRLLCIRPRFGGDPWWASDGCKTSKWKQLSPRFIYLHRPAPI